VRVEGTTIDPSGGGGTLRLIFYAVRVGEGPAVALLFFGSDQAFDEALFDHIVGSLRFDPALL
jgi:hypothetical protein